MSSEDLQEWNQDFKNKRDARFYNFEEEWHEKFEIKFEDDFYFDNKKQCFTIHSSCDLYPEKQFFDFYPKSNKVLIRKENRWKPGGIQFLTNIFNIA